MSNKYHRLCAGNRIVIANMRQAGKNQIEIARTCNLRAAKLKRDEKLEDLRKAESGSQGPDRMQTIGDALETVAKKVIWKRGLKVATVDYYKHAFSTLRKTLPTSEKGSSWTEAQAEKWWRSYRDGHDPRLANTVMRLVRKIGAALIDAGQLRENPAAKLESSKIGKTKVTDLPSAKVLDDLLIDVRSQRKRSSEEPCHVSAVLAATCSPGILAARNLSDGSRASSSPANMNTALMSGLSPASRSAAPISSELLAPKTTRENKSGLRMIGPSIRTTPMPSSTLSNGLD